MADTKVSSEDRRRTFVLDQVGHDIRYYSKASAQAHLAQRFFGVIQITLAAVIPIAVIFYPPPLATKLSAIFAALIAICKGMDELYQTRGSWIRYGRTAVQLHMELESFRALSGQYAEALDPLELLSENCIAIRRNENDAWAAVTASSNSLPAASADKT